MRLNWRGGAHSPNIDIYRNNALIATQPNDPGVYIDSTGDTGRAQYRYTVCEAGTQTCSNEVLVRFPQKGTNRSGEEHFALECRTANLHFVMLPQELPIA